MIQKIQHRIQEEIEKFSAELSVSPAELYEPIRYMLSLGGKRIRPLFVLMSCDLFGGKTEDAIPSALAIELFHNFTLIHDDIMDNATLRRNHLTVHSKWNNSIAILSGDAMMVKAYQSIIRSKLSPQIFDSILYVFNEMAIKICEGQQWDLNYEQGKKISILQYNKMIELKTAVLFASCMKIGSLIGGAKEEDANNLYEFGKNIGMAFQLQDDLLDVYGDTEKFGKQKGGDIIANKKTFLLCKAQELCSFNHHLNKELEQWLNVYHSNKQDASEKIKAVTRIFNSLNIRETTEEEINSFHRQAVESLEKVSTPIEKKKILIEFTSGLLKRES
ncbi:MAG: polyprenyl synthetase family protein [Bacteroidota bacterium]